MHENAIAAASFVGLMQKHFGIGPRTRNVRKGMHLRREIDQAVVHAAVLPGYFGPEKEKAFRVAYAAVLGVDKHIEGYRARPAVVAHVRALSPWQYIALLGDMVTAGVSNQGQAEMFFQKMAA